MDKVTISKMGALLVNGAMTNEEDAVALYGVLETYLDSGREII